MSFSENETIFFMVPENQNSSSSFGGGTEEKDHSILYGEVGVEVAWSFPFFVMQYKEEELEC